MTNVIMYLLMIGSDIVFPAWSQSEAGMVKFTYPHESVQSWHAPAQAVADLRDGYASATYSNGVVTVDGITYAEYVVPPPMFERGLEAPWITLLSVSNQTGWLYISLDDGTLVPVLAHESPWPSEDVIKDRIKSAQTNAVAKRSRAKAQINGQIQQRLENIEHLLGIRE